MLFSVPWIVHLLLIPVLLEISGKPLKSTARNRDSFFSPSNVFPWHSHFCRALSSSHFKNCRLLPSVLLPTPRHVFVKVFKMRLFEVQRNICWALCGSQLTSLYKLLVKHLLESTLYNKKLSPAKELKNNGRLQCSVIQIMFSTIIKKGNKLVKYALVYTSCSAKKKRLLLSFTLQFE